MNKQRAIRAMHDNDLDCIISASRENNAYFSDIPVQGFTIFTSEGRAALIARSVSNLLYENESWIKDISYYGTFRLEKSENPRGPKTKKNPKLTEHERRVNRSIVEGALKAEGKSDVEILAEKLKELGLERGKIGLDGSGMSYPIYLGLRASLKSAMFEDSSQTVSWIRAVKTPEESRRIRRATEIIETGFDSAESAVHVGVTEQDIAGAFRSSVVQTEEVEIGWYSFLAGTRSALCLAAPSEYRLKRGDLVVFHSNLAYKYYHSDIPRCGVLGKPAQEQLKAWNAVVRAEEKMIEKVAPGIRVSELFDLGIRVIRGLGIPKFQRHHLGHGIGLGWGGAEYDPPIITEGNPAELEENMVLCIETPYNKMGFSGMVSEDIGLVTKSGFELFSSHQSKLASF
ncbi:MAG: Xaa-Pro peptidase family protein [Thaumarchaeota archaeon]|nr:Xaa-Pro peptidase family protein [Nitrososphaerota archaeon]